jgi:hypothetical protein
MRLTRAMCAALPGLLVCVVAAGCSDTPTEQPPDTSFVRLVSDPGDFIGKGETYEYTRENATIVFTTYAGYHIHVGVGVSGADGWTGNFYIPGDPQTFQPATYSGAQSYLLADPSVPGLVWSGHHRVCSSLTGSFTIDAVTYTAGTLRSMDLHFEQHCQGGVPALRGTLHLVAQ